MFMRQTQVRRQGLARLSDFEAAYCSRQFWTNSGAKERCQCFLKWIMSVIPDTTVQACSQKVTGNKAVERRVSTVILNRYQSTGIAKGDGSRQSLENH